MTDGNASLGFSRERRKAKRLSVAGCVPSSTPALTEHKNLPQGAKAARSLPAAGWVHLPASINYERS
jgi:hypothetical protein